MGVLALAAICFAQDFCKRHAEPAGGFSFCPPEGWTTREKEGEKFKLFFGPASANFAVNMNVKEEESALPLADYVAAGTRVVLASAEKLGATSIKVVSQSDFVTAAKQPGIKVVYQTLYKGLLIRTIQYLFDGPNQKKLVFTFTALESEKETFDPIFERSVKTFQIDK